MGQVDPYLPVATGSFGDVKQERFARQPLLVDSFSLELVRATTLFAMGSQ